MAADHVDDEHRRLVDAVAARTRHFHAAQTPYRVYHGATNSTRRSHRRAATTVDTSALCRILHVDTDRQTVCAEPNVAMDALVAATLPHGLVPRVVMEFPGITVGGGFSGTSGESSSFRYGAFESTVNRIEIVLPNGTVATASPTEKPDLFWGAASAAGTLGIVTLLEVQLRAAGPFVELTYRLAPDVAAATARLQQETQDAATDFLDGITFADATVLCVGRMVDAVPAGHTPRTFARRRDAWFYLRAERVKNRLQKSAEKITDYVPLTDYLFRYERGGFWMGRSAFRYFRVPFNRLTRWALDPFMHTRVMYRALHASGMSDFYLIQDVGIPFGEVATFVAWLDAHVGLYPLWLCPLRVRRDAVDSRYGLHAAFADPEAKDLMNFGIWGQTAGDRAAVVALNRALEQKVSDLGGTKWLYAQAFYTEDEFWARYDRPAYDALRTKYGATYLPSIYDKVHVDVAAEAAARRASRSARAKDRFWNVWPMRGLYGVYKVVGGGDYLLQKKTKQTKAQPPPPQQQQEMEEGKA